MSGKSLVLISSDTQSLLLVEDRAQTIYNRHVKPIFDNHPTAPFVSIVKSIRALGTIAALLHAIAGMIPPGKTDIEPYVNAHQTLVMKQRDGSFCLPKFLQLVRKLLIYIHNMSAQIIKSKSCDNLK